MKPSQNQYIVNACGRQKFVSQREFEMMRPFFIETPKSGTRGLSRLLAMIVASLALCLTPSTSLFGGTKTYFDPQVQWSQESTAPGVWWVEIEIDWPN